MGSVKLNKEQLQHLAAFIRQKGWDEPVILVEVLDHFACKVEEKLNEKSALTFEEAINAAYEDFGLLGFQPIVANYKEHVKKKYQAISNAERKKVLRSPLHVIMAVIIAILFYKAYIWDDINHFMFDDRGAGRLMLPLVFPTTLAYFFIKFRQKSYNTYFLWHVVGRVGSSFTLVFIANMFAPTARHHNHAQLTIVATLSAAGVFMAVISLVALNRVIKKERDEIERIYNYLRTIQE